MNRIANLKMQCVMGLVALLAVTVHAKTYEAVKGKSEIIYFLKHPLHMVEGVSKEFTCTVDLGGDTSRALVQVKAPVLGFNSGNSSRDAHALETLDAFKYPFVEFVSDSVRHEENGYRVFGQVTFHGVKRALDFRVVPHVAEGAIRIVGEFTLKLSDFKVKRPSLLLVPVEDKLRIVMDVILAGS